ncbi:MAG: DUF3822 family protein [Flavobacteriaceae bacterium]|nr:DUF3822 family protein [Flavobacteriaceae bacterium]MDG2444409.1 DUF3822 family protein [Flavobacteriaceae bacterium]
MTKQIVKKKTINKKIEETSKKKLSIQFSLDGFSFYISNTHHIISKFTSFNFTKPIKSPELILKKIKEIFKNEKTLQQDFETVSVVHQNNLSTLVPNQYFKDDNLNKYLKYSVKTITTDLIVYDDLNFIKAKNVYVPFVNINNFIFQNFGEFEYKHHSSILLEKLFLQSDDSLNFFVNISQSLFDIVVLKDSKILFYNNFEYQTKEDFIYYILFTLEQLELSTDKTKVSLLGDINKQSELYKILYTYVRNISFFNSKNPIFNNQTEIDKHSNFILLG